MRRAGGGTDRDGRTAALAAARPPLRGDEAALFECQAERLLRLIERRLRVSRDIAEEACAFAWLQFVRLQPKREQVVGWLYTVAKHEAFALLRRRSGETPADELPPTGTSGDLIDLVEARDTLRLIGRLKPQQRLVLRLRIEGHSYTAICELTGQSYTWVNRHLTEGRRALRGLRDRGK